MRIRFEALEAAVPLVVDLDGTLLKADLLHETALQFVAQQPFAAWRLAGWILAGKAALKRELAARADLRVETLPFRAEVVALVRQAQDEGRPVYVASASTRPLVDAVAERLGGVAGVFASDETNLAGIHKADALVAAFGRGGFDYVGDRPVDFAVWAMARRVLAVTHGGRFARAVTRRFPEAAIIADAAPGLRTHFRALRPHQWIKNLLIFLPLLAGHQLTPMALGNGMLAFLCFCAAASSSYLVNDLLDLPGDRQHPRKCRRPFAAGDLSAGRGVAMAAAMFVSAFGGAALLGPAFLAVLLGYVIATLAYSLVLKRRVLIDVIVLGLLYTTRVLGGVAAAAAGVSPWLLMFSLFLFSSLAVVKRCSELVMVRDRGRSDAAGRGYRIEDLAILVPLAAATGIAAVLVVGLYITSPEVQRLYRHPEWLAMLCPILMYWVSRVVLLANRGLLHDDPVVFALTDRVSLCCGALSTSVVVAAAL